MREKSPLSACRLNRRRDGVLNAIPCQARARRCRGTAIRGFAGMSAFRRSKIVVPMVSLLTAVAFAAQAQTPPPQGQGQPAQSQPPAKPQVQAKPMPPHPPTGVPGPKGGGSSDARYARGAISPRDYGGQAYRGRVAWDG